MSIIEAKYMEIAKASKEVVRLARLVKELGIEQGGVQLHCDSQCAIDLAKNQMYHGKNNHIDVRFHKIRELMTSGQILPRKVHTSENVAYMLTKAIITDKFKPCLDLLNVDEC